MVQKKETTKAKKADAIKKEPKKVSKAKNQTGRNPKHKIHSVPKAIKVENENEVKIEDKVKNEIDCNKENDGAKSSNSKVKSTRNITFEERLEECKKFKTEHGHCKIPTTAKYNKSLGVWVQEMRRNFKLMATTGKPRRMINSDQIASLNDIGFHWGFKPKAGMPQSDPMWEKDYKEIKEFKEKHGDFNVPKGPLDEWACEQRTQKKKRDSKMKCNINSARIKKLDAIQFNWSGPRKPKIQSE